MNKTLTLNEVGEIFVSWLLLRWNMLSLNDFSRISFYNQWLISNKFNQLYNAEDLQEWFFNNYKMVRK